MRDLDGRGKQNEREAEDLVWEGEEQAAKQESLVAVQLWQ
jgi:hypothetical protein